MDIPIHSKSIFGTPSNGKDSPVDSAAPSTPSTTEEDGITVISTDGNIILQIEHEIGQSISTCRFRVHSTTLANASKYFERLLLPGRFGEGEKVEQELKSLRNRYSKISDAPSTELPNVSIKDVGRISAVKSINPLCTDFLNVLHGKDILATPPVTNLANLAIVADRFDALSTVSGYVDRKRYIRTIDGKTTGKIDVNLTEEKTRQRLLAAILLDYPPWMEKYSLRLITKGWVGHEPPETTTPLWWDLPSRIEDELAIRRDFILDAIQSLQTHFLALYSSRARQCKLGYDSSGQCDTFQLGEMIRFFLRVGTLQLQGTLYSPPDDMPPPYIGDIAALLDALQQAPEYQIDRNHHHCGIRTRLIPLVELLREAMTLVGICAECWTADWAQYAWIEGKQPLLWKRQEYLPRRRGHAHRDVHSHVKALFMANERNWSD